MPNPLKGDVEVLRPADPETARAEERYLLNFSIDALCALEERLGLPIDKILAKVTGSMRLGELRALFAGGLREHHSDITERAAGEMIPQIGVIELRTRIFEALALAFPAPKEAGEADARP